MKMSEIFNLPVTGREFYQHIIAGNTTQEKDRAIANCINHADALADALADLILACYESGHNILACTYAEDALAAYRGEK